MYWYLNKPENRPEIYSSLRAIEINEGIAYERLSYHFSRHKRNRYEDDTHRIEKVQPIASKRSI